MPTAESGNPLQSHFHPLSLKRTAYDPLLEAIGNAQVVLIGDGSHGTYEFYSHRANLTQRLIEEKGFSIVALEADWPDVFRINKYVHQCHLPPLQLRRETAASSLGDFERFPKWLWKNEVMPPFLDFVKGFNAEVMKTTGNATDQVSFYGIDLYSLHRSAQEVISYLQRVDPQGAIEAKSRYNCCERYGDDTTRYSHEAPVGAPKTCQQEVIQNLRALLSNHHKYIEKMSAGGGNGHPAEEQFIAEMNALLVRDAEEYYRTLMQEDTISWNIRDDHFARTIVDIVRHFGSMVPNDATQKDAKVVIWAHNSHTGDARATDMGKIRGEINLGQRCRELFQTDNVFNIGFLTNRGTVTAAYEWDEAPHLMNLNNPIAQSIEKLFDETTEGDGFVITHKIIDVPDGSTKKVEIDRKLAEFLNRPRLQRFIGVIYRTVTEIPSHYTRCKVADQYDAVVHIKVTRGVRPLDPEVAVASVHKETLKGDMSAMYPFGE